MLDFEETAAFLRSEAEDLVDRTGLIALLGEYGRPHLSGSYRTNLMTWRDLDIYLELDVPDVERFLELGYRIGKILRPRRLSFTDHLHFPSTEVLAGLYWGIKTDELSKGGWKIDLWGVTPEVCAERLEHSAALERRLTPQLRSAILRIKREVCSLPSYRDTITSQDVYDAALAGADSSAAFWDYISRR
ncbi:MAG TPA: hypothetical protein VFT37_06160 [Telluria sp.]|nr:hypothetical protein [Telluria sp.]